MTHPVKSPRKLIEVALPLDAINAAAGGEKNNPFIKGHPRSMHTWWARQPLTGARAILFAQLVNDPGYQQGSGFKYGKNKKEAAAERRRLFTIMEDLVKWENTTNEPVLESARAEIRRSWREVCDLNKDHPQASEWFNPEKLPAFHDPFAGGGAIPLEAQRLGLESYATDLNPVAVLINKALIEIPPKFAARPPVHPPDIPQQSTINYQRTWPGATGLAEDIRYYGAWMRDEAQKRIGHFYPPVHITAEMAKDRPDLKSLVGQKLPAIAWLWARTVKSPNPAFSHVEVPLAATFTLSSKEGKEAYIQPIVEGDQYRFTVRLGTPTAAAQKGTKADGRGASFRCLLSDTAISGDYIKAEGQASRIGQRLMAVVVEGNRGRVYLPPTAEAIAAASAAAPTWRPDLEFFQQALGFRVGNYGIRKWSELFTQRQLLAMTTLCDLVSDARERVRQDAVTAQLANDETGLECGGTGATAYAEAVSVYLGMATSRWADFCNTICSWNEQNQNIRVLFARQAIPMSWDFAELSPFSSVGPWFSVVESIVKALPATAPNGIPGHAFQDNASTQTITRNKTVSTDPPYFDNIGYADLSDFFYVWLRKSLHSILPSLLATISVPKSEELVATPARHGSRERAEKFFLDGMTNAMARLADQAHPAGPITIYYAFKQSDTDSESGTASAGWETFLQAVSRASLQLSGTWPMRTNKQGRARDNSSNALASAITLVCRKRQADAPTISRREFLRELNGVLPEALDEMTKGTGGEYSPVAPVDLSQAIIGPGMAVFSKYAAVLEADGTPMNVRTALQLINRFLAEDDFDHDTQFCLHWFEQHGWSESVFGEADTLARAKGTSVDGVKEAGVIQSGGGKVRLLKWSECPTDWDPRTDTRTPIWEALHQLIRALRQGGDSASGALLAALGGKTEAVRQLAYRLYTLCERLGQAEDARAYNELITSWTGIETAAASAPKPAEQDLPGYER
jgi:putative DNA methylase